MCVSMVYPFVHFPPMFVRESRSMYGSCAEPLAIDRHVSWFARGRSPFTHRTPLWSQTHRGLKTNIGSRAEKSIHQKGESGEKALWHRSEVSVTLGFLFESQRTVRMASTTASGASKGTK